MRSYTQFDEHRLPYIFEKVRDSYKNANVSQVFGFLVDIWKTKVGSFTFFCLFCFVFAIKILKSIVNFWLIIVRSLKILSHSAKPFFSLGGRLLEKYSFEKKHV